MNQRWWKRVVIAVIVTLTGVGLYYLFLFSPELVWDPYPETLIIYTGVGVRHNDYNYIPDFQLWGDGRVVWVNHLPDGKRKVFEAHVSEKEILNILERLKDAGFFQTRFHLGKEESLRCNYQGFEDAYIYVNLTHNFYGEGVWMVDRDICDAINAVVTGTGIAGQEYVPDVGKVYFVPIGETDLPPDTQAVYQWSDTDFRFRPEVMLASKQNGIEITGEELKLAWEIVNRSSQPVVESNGQTFWMAVTVDGL